MIRRLHLLAFSLIAIAACADTARADKIWWAHNAAGRHWIQRSNLDGSNVEEFVVNLGRPFGMAVDPFGEILYWAIQAGPLPTGIHRFDLVNGANQEPVITETAQIPHALALDLIHGHIYWTESEDFSGPGAIYRASLDGSNVEELVSIGIEFPRGIALDVPRGKMYWTDFDLGLVNRANLDGSNVETIIENAESPWGIAIDEPNRKLYWDDARTGMHRCDLDGTNDDVLPIGGATGIALDVGRGHIY